MGKAFRASSRSQVKISVPPSLPGFASVNSPSALFFTSNSKGGTFRVPAGLIGVGHEPFVFLHLWCL